jgi:hypothetical protein
MLVNTLSFRDHLDLTNRLEIALEYLKQGGFYGVVTDLANAYNTSRTGGQRTALPVFPTALPRTGRANFSASRLSTSTQPCLCDPQFEEPHYTVFGTCSSAKMEDRLSPSYIPLLGLL